MVNEFLTYGGSEIRYKLLKIMNMIFEKEKVSNDFRKPELNHCIRKVIRVTVVITEAFVWSL